MKLKVNKSLTNSNNKNQWLLSDGHKINQMTKNKNTSKMATIEWVIRIWPA